MSSTCRIPTIPISLSRRHRLDDFTPNLVAVHPVHDYFLVVTGKAGVVGTVFAYSLFDGELLASAAVGIQPDAVVISPMGNTRWSPTKRKAQVATTTAAPDRFRSSTSAASTVMVKTMTSS